MNIFVCVKQVPDTETKIVPTGDGTFIETASIKWIMNPYCEFAVEQALLVQAALIEAYVDNAKSDPALMKKVKAAIAQGAKGMGLDLYKMTLTSDGFVPDKRGSAIDEDDLQSGSESDEQALASTEPAESGESPNYALIAAAGAGLGGMFLLGKVMGRKS